ncbi:MAG: hypothetical protein Kow0025_20990 [Thermodesulfovibrionales bacterium]
MKTANEMARLLAISEQHFYRLVRRTPDFPKIRLGNRLRFEPEAVLLFLAARGSQADRRKAAAGRRNA